MKSRILLPALMALIALVAPSAAARETQGADTVSAADAFVRLPAMSLDLLTKGMRLDLVDYYRADSIYRVTNAMEGKSYLLRPLTDKYIKVQVTPVTTITLRVLPGKKDETVVSSYTIGDSLQAHDSDIRFYDTAMRELPRDRFIRLAEAKDFFIFDGVSSRDKKDLLTLVPFPTVEYILYPDNCTLTARLTVGDLMSRENLDRIKPYLRRERVYDWNGKKFVMRPLR